MSISVGGQGNVDGEGGTENGVVHPGTMGSPWGPAELLPDHIVRVRVEPPSVQPLWTLRRVGPTFTISMVIPVEGIPTPSVALEIELAELTDDAHDHGANDER